MRTRRATHLSQSHVSCRSWCRRRVSLRHSALRRGAAGTHAARGISGHTRSRARRGASVERKAARGVASAKTLTRERAARNFRSSCGCARPSSSTEVLGWTARLKGLVCKPAGAHTSAPLL
eukprot:5521618-Prymnesium_polylepis.1